MYAVAPDLIADVRELSIPVSATGVLLGFALWLFGWRGHRFWIVLSATLLGGITGLTNSPAYGIQPLVAGLLAAVAAGILALALVRVLAFAAGGATALLAAKVILPGWEQPLVTALVGGLLGVALFRYWTMLVTSAVGTLLTLYGSLALLDRLRTLNSVSFASDNVVLLNWTWASVSLLGLLAQFLLERRRLQKDRKAEEAAKAKEAEEEEKKKAKAAPPPPPLPTLWTGIKEGLRRMAG